MQPMSGMQSRSGPGIEDVPSVVEVGGDPGVNVQAVTSEPGWDVPIDVKRGRLMRDKIVAGVV